MTQVSLGISHDGTVAKQPNLITQYQLLNNIYSVKPINVLLSVWGQELFPLFVFCVPIGILLRDVVKSSLLSKDEH